MSTDKKDVTGLSQSMAGAATMRIATLHKTDSFHTPLEERFERITRIGKKIMGVRVAGVTLIADETLWFKSINGWSITELPLKNSLEQPMLERGEPLTTDLWNAQSQLVGKLDTARRQALLDPLTRIWNRRGGMELLGMVQQESISGREQFAVCLVDIDHFKAINDKHGHGIGDQTLRKVAAGITASIRPDDVVSRYGGDEFLVILRNATPGICRLVAERICGKSKKHRCALVMAVCL